MRSRRSKAEDLHGNVPDKAPIVLMLVDVMNDLVFPNNEELIGQAPRLGRTISKLKQRRRILGIPTIYVNDNRDKWRSDFKAVVAHGAKPGSAGWPLVELLLSSPDDYFILKPKHSAFHATPLDTILTHLKTRTVILTGLTTAACVLLTAGEIYVRDLKLYVPEDCVAALRRADQRKALDIMRRSFGAITTASARLGLKKLINSSRFGVT